MLIFFQHQNASTFAADQSAAPGIERSRLFLGRQLTAVCQGVQMAEGTDHDGRYFVRAASQKNLLPAGQNLFVGQSDRLQRRSTGGAGRQLHPVDAQKISHIESG